MIRTLLALSLSLVAPASETSFKEGIAKLESRHGGRLGVSALELGERKAVAHRGGERFAMCSTFKFLLAAAVAARVDAGDEQWERKIPYGKEDLIPWTPVTGKEENLKAGAMSVAELCEATMIWSDNTAANLLLDTVGGPEGLTRYLRSIDDKTSRLDRNEPGLNANLRGDERDTTTPDAMVATMEKLLLGTALKDASKEKLTAWLVGNRTGDRRIRAAMDPTWKTGDKTGTGQNGAANDIAIVWPADRKPVLIAIYYDGADATADQRETVIADAAKLVRETLVVEE
ncbi:class A beta-lactamase [Luteolibacter flavescens]|uniref:beta-lactamase n=1 Tax=Luteolibacter flavescens TaxID=1859460 RepID=A0ABT3FKH0_9BACT|nr:class A beta-lactamase [Luteolibacter flavescens]MCW1884073.1 class A beta-lactamase [Luteolibacter flavescens]